MLRPDKPFLDPSADGPFGEVELIRHTRGGRLDADRANFSGVDIDPDRLAGCSDGGVVR